MENEYVVQGRPQPEEHNELFNQGYKFYVEGDWKTGGQTDPWSGMPNVIENTHYFVNKADAEEYAAKQTWPFNPNMHGEVKPVKRRETSSEYQDRMAAEKQARKDKKYAADKKKADALGITVDELKKRRARQSSITRLKNEIEWKEKELEELYDELAQLQYEETN